MDVLVIYQDQRVVVPGQCIQTPWQTHGFPATLWL